LNSSCTSCAFILNASSILIENLASLYVSDISPLLDSALTQHTLDKMTNSRKIPYVEILVKPRYKRPPSRSSSPTIEPPPKSHRKNRKSSDDHLSDDDMPNMVMDSTLRLSKATIEKCVPLQPSAIKVKRRKLLSPTISDYDIDVCINGLQAYLIVITDKS